MGLKIFNIETSSHNRGAGVSTIYFAISGANTLSKAATAALDLKIGDKISIAQDEKDARTFYLFKDSKNGFPLRDYNKSTGGLAFNNTLVAKAACANFTDDRKSVTCKLILEPQKIDGLTVYPIIVPKQA